MSYFSDDSPAWPWAPSKLRVAHARGEGVQCGRWEGSSWWDAPQWSATGIRIRRREKWVSSLLLLKLVHESERQINALLYFFVLLTNTRVHWPPRDRSFAVSLRLSWFLALSLLIVHACSQRRIPPNRGFIVLSTFPFVCFSWNQIINKNCTRAWRTTDSILGVYSLHPLRFYEKWGFVFTYITFNNTSSLEVLGERDDLF